MNQEESKITVSKVASAQADAIGPIIIALIAIRLQPGFDDEQFRTGISKLMERSKMTEDQRQVLSAIITPLRSDSSGGF